MGHLKVVQLHMDYGRATPTRAGERLLWILDLHFSPLFTL